MTIYGSYKIKKVILKIKIRIYTTLYQYRKDQANSKMSIFTIVYILKASTASPSRYMKIPDYNNRDMYGLLESNTPWQCKCFYIVAISIPISNPRLKRSYKIFLGILFRLRSIEKKLNTKQIQILFQRNTLAIPLRH